MLWEDTLAGISELSLNDSADGAFLGGSEVKSNSSYRRSDGTEHTLAAVNFIADPNGLTDSCGIDPPPGFEYDQQRSLIPPNARRHIN